MRADVPGPTTRFRHSRGRQGNRRQPLSSAVAGGTTGEGRSDPSPNPYRPGSGKPTHSYTGQHIFILANKVQGSTGMGEEGHPP